jgi:hypothetical protein
MIGTYRLLALATGLAAAPAAARPAVRCAGAVLMGAAQLLCSHADPMAPTQTCTYRWELATDANQPQLAQGSFAIPPGASNVQIWQGSGFARALTSPIVLCQGRRGGP